MQQVHDLGNWWAVAGELRRREARPWAASSLGQFQLLVDVEVVPFFTQSRRPNDADGLHFFRLAKPDQKAPVAGAR